MHNTPTKFDICQIQFDEQLICELIEYFNIEIFVDMDMLH